MKLLLSCVCAAFGIVAAITASDYSDYHYLALVSLLLHGTSCALAFSGGQDRAEDAQLFEKLAAQAACHKAETERLFLVIVKLITDYLATHPQDAPFTNQWWVGLLKFVRAQQEQS